MSKYKLSSRSKEKAVTCNHKIQDVVNFVLEHIDVGVIHGHRGEETQNDLYNKGASKLKFPHSKHNTYPSNAIDLVIYVEGVGYIDEKTSKKYRSYYGFLAGLIHGYCSQKGYKVVWGADWDSDRNLEDQSFDDLMHFEIT